MKTLRLTDDQYTLLQALINNDAFYSDQMMDVVFDAAAEIVPASGDEEEYETKHAALWNGLVEALGTPVDEAPNTDTPKC